MRFLSNRLVGTSGWSSQDWCGSFYPDSIDPGEMIHAYSGMLPTVKIDSTWYRTPSPGSHPSPLSLLRSIMAVARAIWATAGLFSLVNQYLDSFVMM